MEKMLSESVTKPNLDGHHAVRLATTDLDETYKLPPQTAHVKESFSSPFGIMFFLLQPCVPTQGELHSILVHKNVLR